MAGQDGRVPAGLPYLAAVVLAAVFLRSAQAKLVDPAATARTFAALGVPRPWPVARTLPFAEGALAVGLIVVPGWAGALAVAFLLGATAFLAGRLRAGVTTPCGCFGPGNDPLSWVDLARNGVLVVAAVVSTMAREPLIPSPSAVALVAAATVLLIAGIRMARRVATMPTRSE